VSGAWLPWALVSAGFAAATAILAKLGVAGIPSDLATAIRTAVVLVCSLLLVAATGEWRAIGDLSGRGWLFLTLSGLATGASWLAWFRALSLGPAGRVAPVDKLSVVLVALIAAATLGERYSPTAWAGIALVAVGAVLVAVG
jgi:bacterial/archaeal transporter family protein